MARAGRRLGGGDTAAARLDLDPAATALRPQIAVETGNYAIAH
jgi:hypothetical protein